MGHASARAAGWNADALDSQGEEGGGTMAHLESWHLHASVRRLTLAIAVTTALLLAACAPAAPSPTAAPPPSKPTEAPAAKPAESKPAAAPTTAPAAKPAEAKPAASPAAKPEAKATRVYKVGISQFFSHPVIDDYREGFIEGMKKSGFVEGQGVTYDRQNGQFNMDTLRSIAQKLQADRNDLILTLTTPATLATLGVIKETPVVFGLLTDPVAAGVLKNPDKPEGNATGVMNWWPTDKQLEYIKKVLPNMKRVGVPYNSGEANSRVQVDALKKIAPQMGLEIVETNAANTNEVQQAVQALAGRADTILVIGDNTIQAGLGVVIKVGFENKMPVVTADPENAKDGALTGWGILQKDAGEQTGELAAKILKGARVQDVPVERPRKYWWTVNTAAAERLGITIPEDVLKQVDLAYKEVKLQ
jgi:putative ABC transport system substrate-binding protein